MNAGGIFSKITQQQGASYLTLFCQKLVKEHEALESGLATWVTSLNMVAPSQPESPFVINHENS